MKKLKDILKEFESGADQLKRMRANQSIHRSEEERLGIDPFKSRGKTYDPKTGSFSRKKRPKKTLVDMYFDQTNNGKDVDIKRLKGKVKKLIMTFLKDMGYDAKFSDMFGAGLQNYIQKNKWPKGRKLYADEIIVLKYFMGWYEKNYDIEVQPGGMSDVNPFRTYMTHITHPTSESKINLDKKYKQLFEGKTRSNDGVLLTERRESALADDIVAELKRNSILNRLGMDHYDPFVSFNIGVSDKPFIMMYFLPMGRLPYGQENLRGKVNQLQKKIKTVIEKELEKIVGVNDIDDYTVVYNPMDNPDKAARTGELDFAIFSERFGDGPETAKEGDGVIETLANLSTAEIRKIEKSIYIEDGSVEGRDRQVNGTIEIAGKKLDWNMDTSDGMSTSYLGDEEDEDGILHDILIDAVEDAGYALEDEDY